MFSATMLYAQPAGQRLAESLRNNVVRINPSGFGFIVGEDQGQLYIVTARHVVGDEDSVRITYRPRRVERVATRLSSYQDEDLILLHAEKPFEAFTWERASMAPPDSIKRFKEVWFVGRGEEWFVPTGSAVGTVSLVRANGIIEVDITSVRPGTSGAPMITEDGIIGMVIRDNQMASAEALSIEVIKGAFGPGDNWEGYTWSLQHAPIYTRNKPAVVKVQVNARYNGDAISSCGTGFFISSGGRTGQIITASHVVGDAAWQDPIILVSGVDDNGQPIHREADLFDRDPGLDLALLTVDVRRWRMASVTLGDSDTIEYGDELIGIGYGGGTSHCNDIPGFRIGRVAGPDINNRGHITLFTLEDDTAIRIGDSGGPLFNVEGEVVAMVQQGVPPALAVASTILQDYAATIPSTEDDETDSFTAGTLSMSSASWCSDGLTICWKKRGSFFNGVRLLFEPTWGGYHDEYLGVNEIDNTNEFSRTYRFGAEFNVYRAFVAVQIAFFLPREIEFKGGSHALNALADSTTKRVDTPFAGQVGLSFFDGLVSAGVGYVRYDKDDFNTANEIKKDESGNTVETQIFWDSYLHDQFFYVNVQPVAFVRFLIKQFLR